jgi:hypothetical protein
MKISRSDKLRIALAPLHLVIGSVLVSDFVRDRRAPMVLVLGLLFIAFGFYRLALIRRALKSRHE